MADLGTFTKSADIVARCPVQVNSTYSAVGETDKYVCDVENYICAATRYDWVGNYASLTTNFKLLLKEVGACICAMYVIQHDLSGFSGRNGETALDFLHYRVIKGMEVLSETASRKAMGGE